MLFTKAHKKTTKQNKTKQLNHILYYPEVNYLA